MAGALAVPARATRRRPAGIPESGAAQDTWVPLEHRHLLAAAYRSVRALVLCAACRTKVQVGRVDQTGQAHSATVTLPVEPGERAADPLVVLDHDRVLARID